MGRSGGTGTGMGAGLGCAEGEETRVSHRSWIRPSLNQGDPASSPAAPHRQPSMPILPKPENSVPLSIFLPLPICLREVGVSQHGHRAEPRCLLVLPGLLPAVGGQQGPGRARGAPLGDVLTPRERALLRTADPASRRPTAEVRQTPYPWDGHRHPKGSLYPKPHGWWGPAPPACCKPLCCRESPAGGRPHRGDTGSGHRSCWRPTNAMWLKSGPGPSSWSSGERVGAGVGFGVMVGAPV